ncbi:MAG: tyrosine-type recombinase/integrase [Christensenellales bacterium]
MKFSECIKMSKSINNNNLKDRTKNLYTYLTKQYVDPYFDNLNIEDLNEDVLQDSLIFLANKKLSTNTIKLIWRLVKSLIKENKIKINLENIIIPKTHEKQVDAFTKHEQKQIEDKLNISRSPKHIGILLALYLGLRLGETLALKWEDIDFSNKVINIKRTVYVEKRNLKYSTPKTKSSIRTIPLPQFLEVILKKIKSKSNCEFIVSQKDKPIVPRTYQHLFKSLQNKAKITNPKGFHSLRHTFATRAIECGMDIKSLADILGHKNPTVTLNRYAHSMMDYKKSMMNKIGKLYN